MRLLAFDTSGQALSAACALDGRLLGHRRQRLDRGHAERLLPVLSELLAETGWRWDQIELVAVTLGPGSFTGLRAGIAVARALGLTPGCLALGLGTLEVLAEAASAAAPDDPRPIAALIDARRGEVYGQRFKAGLAPLAEAALLPATAVPELARGCRLVGTPAAWTAVGLDGLDRDADARDLARLAWRRLAAGVAPAAATDLRPLYLRAPDARPGAGASLLVETS